MEERSERERKGVWVSMGEMSKNEDDKDIWRLFVKIVEMDLLRLNHPVWICSTVTLKRP
jgi:hypothetical protein